jgi:hypothetical protein
MTLTAAAHCNTQNSSARNGVVRRSEQTTCTTTATMSRHAATATSYYQVIK